MSRNLEALELPEPDALDDICREIGGHLWRRVEAQHDAEYCGRCGALQDAEG